MTTLYLQLFERIKDSIQQGRLLSGERLPSVRAYSEKEGLSKNTVLMAYALLQEQGLILSREKQGFFVAELSLTERLPLIPRSQKKVISLDVVDEVQWTLDSLADPGIINLSAAVPDPVFLPTKVIGRFMRSHAEKTESYSEPKGHPLLRQALFQRYHRNLKRVDPNDIVVTNGAMESIFIALKTLCREGDYVLLENPTYYMYFKLLRSLGLRVIQVSSSPDNGLCIDGVEKVLSSMKVAAILCQPSFANPLGSEMPPESKQKLVELSAKYDIPLIQDDIAGELCFDGRRRPTLMEYSKADNIIYVSSFSKTFSPGLRIGWLLSSRWSEEMKRTKTLISICQTVPGQLAMADFLTKGNPDRWLKKMRRALPEQLQEYKAFIRSQFPEGTTMTCPNGGFVLWVELPQEYDSHKISRRCRDAGITLTPGPIFSASQDFNNCLRINYAFALKGEKMKAMKRLVELI